MDECPQVLFGNYAWQASFSGILLNLGEQLELVNNSTRLCRQVRKELTTEALLVILVILLFLLINLIRSAISVYECCKGSKYKTHSSTGKKGKVKDGAKNSKDVKKSSETSSTTVSQTNLRRFLDCFCIKTNARKILSADSSQEQFGSIYGIRSITMIWLLLGHISPLYVASSRESEFLKNVMNSQPIQILKSANLIIEGFLVLSGFLNGYFFSQFYEKRKGQIPWLSFCAHRIIRIMPLYCLVLGFYAAVVPHLGSGPVWPTYSTNPVCKDNWIWNVLFINNFSPHTDICLQASWYLSCDLQLYIICSMILPILLKFPKILYFLIAVCISVSSYLNFTLTMKYQLVDGPARIGDFYMVDLKYFQKRFWLYYEVLHSKPYTRIGTYLIGIVFGYYMYKRKSSPNKKMNQLKLTLGWIMCAVFMLFSIYGFFWREEAVIETAVYNTVKNITFCSSIIWIIFVCQTGQAGFVYRFLSSKVFLVMSRVSYTSFLLHMGILEALYVLQRDQIDHTIPTMFLHFSLTIWIIVVSFVISVLFEAPIMKITAMFLGERSPCAD